jgi:hypothetical protein
MKVDAKLAEQVPLTHKFDKRSCVDIQRAHLIHSIGPNTNVLKRFGPFRCCPKVDAKLAKLAPLTYTFAK